MGKRNKFQRLYETSNGDDGIFYFLFRIQDKDLRNSIAHSDIDLDRENNQVIYFGNKSGKRTEFRLDIFDFGAKVYSMSIMPSIYLAAISAIIVIENGNAALRAKIPQTLVDAYKAGPSSNN